MALAIVDRNAFTTTFIIPRAVQNFFKSNALWFRAKKKGQRFDGGQQIEAPIFYDKFVSGGAFEDRDALTVTNNQVVTAATYQLREYFVPISVSDRDMAINSGKAAVMSFVKQKINHGRDQIADILGTDTQASNSGGKELEGLGLAMSTSSTLGAVAPAAAPIWKANILAASSNIMTVLKLQTVLGQCTFGASRPTLIISNQACYDKFSTFGDTVQRIVDTDMASVGIAQLNFRGVPWVVDSHAPGGGGGATNNVVEFINEDYTQLWTAKGWDFKTEQMARTQSAAVQYYMVWWKGNWTYHSRRHLGELTSIDPNLS